MDENPGLLPQKEQVPLVTTEKDAPEGAKVVATRDHDVIRKWARAHSAEPATGQASASGAETSMRVRDDGAGIRFNFPGVSRFRPIAWDEWLAHFDRERLTFVFEPGASPASGRYRLVQADDWDGRIER